MVSNYQMSQNYVWPKLYGYFEHENSIPKGEEYLALYV